MKWEKQGLIFNPEYIANQGLTCALMPIVELLDNEKDIVRVYYSPRDKDNKSQLYFFDCQITNPQNIIQIGQSPVYTHGCYGAFDDCGVTPGSFSEVNGKKVYYYTGWSLTRTVPMNNSIGIALFNSESEQFERIGSGPIMTRTLQEPFSCASPFVLKEKSKYKMWYASMDEWRERENDYLHIYNLKYAESNDGVNWSRANQVVLDYADDTEYAFGRPFVLREDNKYKMWYAVRGEFYRIGYAESDDGVAWKRLDHLAGIDVSPSGWDSDMIEYPFIFDHKNQRYMFYNGNGYGKTGIGLAKLIES